MELDEKYWNERYEENLTGWDLGLASPPLTAYINQLEDKRIRILIPGCGNAYEAEYLKAKGFENITLIDVSESLTQKLQLRWKEEPSISIIHGDFFKLDKEYDLILEQTFFCALHPKLRNAYALKMNTLLSNKGKLVGVLFNRTFEKEGPPFGGSQDEYRQLFEPLFHIDILETCTNSILPRQNNEVFIKVRKNPIN